MRPEISLTLKTAKDALKQIDDRGCLIPYSAGSRALVKAGVVFDTDARTLGEWRVQISKAPENVNAASD